MDDAMRHDLYGETNAEPTDEQRRARRRLREAYRDVANSPSGKIVLDDLARFTMANATTFTPDDPHGRVSAFREGCRNVYLYIQKQAAIEPSTPADRPDQPAN